MSASHHTSKGVRNPWPGGEPAGFAGVLKWMLGERIGGWNVLTDPMWSARAPTW